jgi:amino acid permease
MSGSRRGSYAVEIPSDPEKPRVSIGPDGLPISPVEEDAVVDHVEGVEGEEEEIEEVSESFSELIRTRRFATIMICLNSLLGVGILGVPRGCANSGLVLAVFLLLLMSFLSLISTYLIIILAKQTRTEGLPDLARTLLGPWGGAALSILTLCFLVCSLCSYLILGGGIITSWLSLAGVTVTKSLYKSGLVFLYAIIPISLTMPRDISFLSYISAATVLSVFFYIFAMIYQCVRTVGSRGIHPTVRMANPGMGLFSSIGMFGLCFSLPAVVLPAIHAYNPLTRKRKIVSGIALGLVTLLAIASGVTGYLMFGEESDGTILSNFPDSNILFVVVRGGFFIVVTCVYPMLGQSVMSSWAAVIFKDSRPAEMIWWKRAVVLGVTNVIPLLIGMFLPTIEPVLEVSGALGGCLVDFVFPALMWIKHSDKPITDWRNLFCVFLGIFGLVCGVISTYEAVVGAIKAFSG